MGEGRMGDAGRAADLPLEARRMEGGPAAAGILVGGPEVEARAGGG